MIAVEDFAKALRTVLKIPAWSPHDKHAYAHYRQRLGSSRAIIPTREIVSAILMDVGE